MAGEPASRHGSVFALLASREVGGARHCTSGRRPAAVGAPGDVVAGLRNWAEADSLRRCSASYCALHPPPRSTIAAAYSPDGLLLASTHGDHTVKLICTRTGVCVGTLAGHRRTPWVVRFHPRNSALLASGSLDYEVRVWHAPREACVASFVFGRAIASLAFYPDGELLAVASGHKLYLWQYAREGSADAPPPVALKTRRSLRAVHFHPRGGQLLLTAEVNEPEGDGPPPAPATTRPAGVQPGAEWGAAFAALRAVASTRLAGDQPTYFAAAAPPPQQQQQQPQAEGAPQQAQQAGLVEVMAAATAAAVAAAAAGGDDGLAAMEEDSAAPPPPPQQLPPALLSAWGEAGGAVPPAATAAAAAAAAYAAAMEAAAEEETPCTVNLRVWGFSGEAALAPPPRRSAPPGSMLLPPPPLRVPELLTIPHAVLCSEMGAHFSPCGRYLAACVACTPLEPLEPQQQQPQPPRPPRAPPAEGAAAASGADAPADAAAARRPLVYELRLYSLAPETFGTVIAARAVRAAHCLTSVQFSPTSRHLLLAYGRRHLELLRSFVARGGSVVPVHTVLEVYRTRDMALARQLASADDEVNVACFHPHAGGGLAYGTKEGRVRLLRHDRAPQRALQRRPAARGRGRDAPPQWVDVEASDGFALWAVAGAAHGPAHAADSDAEL